MTRSILAVTLLCAAFASVPARAEQDEVQFFSNIHVSSDSSVHDAVCFFCSVDLEGKATGDIVVFFGNVHIANDAQHDVVNFFGHVTADDNASIEHDLVSMFGGIRLGDNVHVGEDLVAYGPMFFLVLVLILIVREYRNYRRRLFLRGYQFPPRM
jgi:hypothetical protein